MKKTAILVMIITIFAKVFGFGREIILSYFYGASNISDAYLISLTIPGTIFSVIGAGISTGYIPMYSKIEQEFGKDEGNMFTNNLVNILFIICTIIVILGLIFTNQIVKIFASGFQGDTLRLTLQFTRISLLGIYFTGLIYIFSGFLQIKGNYIMPALVSLPLNLITILSIYLSSFNNILILSIGTTIATASQLLLLIPFLYKKGYRYNLVLNLKSKHVKNMALLFLPVLIGVSVNQINVLVDRTLASSIAVGGISALNYANRLNNFVQGIFVVSISTVMYPMISKMVSNNNIKGLKRALNEGIIFISILVVPTTIGAMIFSEPIVNLLFGRGEFDSQAIGMTSNALYFYSIGMIGFGLRQILSRFFYSMQDTRTPMINSAIGMVLNIVLNIILIRFLGIGGLALATSISAIFTTILLFINLRIKIGSFGIKNIGISFLKILSASIIMGIISKILFNYLESINILSDLSLAISIIVGGLVYLLIVYFIRIEEVDTLVDSIKIKLKSL